ncbi:MAG: iron ABC transporter permease [Thermoleophilia bacterium]|nr:iron ABC transporter permease [Thermoleophilia bacterium]
MTDGLTETVEAKGAEAPELGLGSRLKTLAVRLRVPALIVVPILVFLLSLTLGRYSVSLGELFTLFGAKLGLTDATVSQEVSTVILNVRLPRIIAAMLIGAGLALSGAAYQGMFRNPLVSSDILGASAGAGFGAALGIMLSKSVIITQFLALGFGLAAVLATYMLAGRLRRGDPTLFLVLTGILVGTVFTSLISILKVLADPSDKLPTITFWLMGSLAAVNRQDILILIGPMLVGGIALLVVRWHLNPLSFGEEEAQAMGSETTKMRIIVIGACTLMTASAVAVAGIVGWVGLIIPHVARGLVGPDYGKLLPVSAVIGGVYLLLIDDVARLAGALEIPLGILTALIGAPFFIFLLARTRRAWT